MQSRPENHHPADKISLTNRQIRTIHDALTDLDEFLRGHPGVREALSEFLAGRGQNHPRFDANNLIDQISFTALGLRQLLNEADSRT
jgi:hypothetical protein